MRKISRSHFISLCDPELRERGYISYELIRAMLTLKAFICTLPGPIFRISNKYKAINIYYYYYLVMLTTNIRQTILAYADTHIARTLLNLFEEFLSKSRSIVALPHLHPPIHRASLFTQDARCRF